MMHLKCLRSMRCGHAPISLSALSILLAGCNASSTSIGTQERTKRSPRHATPPPPQKNGKDPKHEQNPQTPPQTPPKNETLPQTLPQTPPKNEKNPNHEKTLQTPPQTHKGNQEGANHTKTTQKTAEEHDRHGSKKNSFLGYRDVIMEEEPEGLVELVQPNCQANNKTNVNPLSDNLNIENLMDGVKNRKIENEEESNHEKTTQKPQKNTIDMNPNKNSLTGLTKTDLGYRESNAIQMEDVLEPKEDLETLIKKGLGPRLIHMLTIGAQTIEDLDYQENQDTHVETPSANQKTEDLAEQLKNMKIN